MIDTSLLRKKLIYRSWHRGCKETDILLGYFALHYISKLSLNELIDYEEIINLNDHELYCYITGKKTPSSNLNGKILNLITFFLKTNPLFT